MGPLVIRRTQKQSRTLAALAAAVAVTVAGCGDDADSAAAGNPTDRAFVAEMVPHHQSALDMAKIAKERAESPFAKQLAEDILRTQSAEITELRDQDAELADAGIKAGKLSGDHGMMGMDEDTAALETARPFDRAFLTMMLPHHSSAVSMAKTELAEGEDPELKALAQRIIDAQTREIRAMRGAATGRVRR